MPRPPVNNQTLDAPFGQPSKVASAIKAAELNVLRRRAKALALALDDLADHQLSAPINFYREVEAFEIRLIRWALDAAGGKQNVAAELLGLKSKTLNSIIKRYGLIIEKELRF